MPGVQWGRKGLFSKKAKLNAEDKCHTDPFWAIFIMQGCVFSSKGVIVLDGIRDTLMEELDSHTAFTIPIFGGIPVAESVVVTWDHGLSGDSFHSVYQTSEKGACRAQLVAEICGFINKFTRNTLGEEHWRGFAPYFGTIGLYLAVANMIGMFGITPPTKDLNVTAGLALMSCGLIYGSSFKIKGLKGGLHKFIEPIPLLLPINLMEVIIRPLSLCMRLFGNVLGVYIIMG